MKWQKELKFKMTTDNKYQNNILRSNYGIIEEENSELDIVKKTQNPKKNPSQTKASKT